MTAETIVRHILLLTGVIFAFYFAGYIGIVCEAQHFSLAMSTMVFGVSFTSFSASFYKLYQLVTFYFFG